MTPKTCLLLAMTSLLAGAALCEAAAPARSSPRRSTPAPTVWMRRFAPPTALQVTLNENYGSFSVTSKELGLLRAASTMPLHDPASPCQIQVEVRKADRGFDLAYVVSNPTNAPLSAPKLIVDGFPLGSKVEFLDHSFGCEFGALQPQPNGAITSWSPIYPDFAYSPVMVLRDDEFAVGLSLQYPVLKYRQSVKMFAARWPGASNWTAYFSLQGTIAPGESREYVLSASYALPTEWIHTVQPYRDHFWSLYGNRTSYTQDLRPVYASSMTSQSFFAPDNPRGFYPNVRPDLLGWKGVVDWFMADTVGKGYKRLMIWNSSGIYQTNFSNNFPPQVMSEWSEVQSKTAGEFRRLQSRGVQVCFWWGHSAHVADKWDDDELEPLDTANPAHVKSMMGEWELLVKRGADGAGLDAFEVLPIWEQSPWLAKMRAQKPNAFLIGEAAGIDVLHLEVPFWINGSDLPSGSPHLLADYLVPGREIHVQLVGQESIDLDRIKELVFAGNTVLIHSPTVTAFQIERFIREALQQWGAPALTTPSSAP